MYPVELTNVPGWQMTTRHSFPRLGPNPRVITAATFNNRQERRLMNQPSINNKQELTLMNQPSTTYKKSV